MIRDDYPHGTDTEETTSEHERRSENDSYSIAPGLKAYITQELAASFHEFFDSSGGLDYLNVRLSPASDETSLHVLHLVQGCFETGFGVMAFNTGATLDEEGLLVKNGLGVMVNYAGVVRIAGDHGETWQNRDFTPTGIPLNS